MPSAADNRHRPESRTSSSSSSMRGGGGSGGDSGGGGYHCSLSLRGNGDDVWLDVMRQQEEDVEERVPSSSSSAGGLSLEEFLAHSSHFGDSHKEDGLSTLPPQHQQSNLQLIPAFAPSDVTAFGYAAGISGLPPLGEGPGDRGTKHADEVSADRPTDRKQRRMIKNRESAARSRAKKQAYVKQLEEKARWLERTNKILRKRKEWEMLINSSPCPVPGKYRLRRTRSGPL